MHAIEVRQLTKRFGTLTAVNGVSFTVEQGEVLGFLGPNGAGKSTTMKLITGFLEPSGGYAKVYGHDVVEEPIEAKRKLGYLPEGAPLYGEMTPRGFLEFIAEIRGFKGTEAERRIAQVVEKVHLEGVMGQRIETLSKGYKRRVGLAQALLHDPEVLILDEPTDGLDPNQKHEVRTLIHDMARDKSIIISTHILEEVDAVCTRAMIIGRGRVLFSGTPAEFAARSEYHNAVSLVVRSGTAAAAKRRIEALAGVVRVEEGAVTDGQCASLGDAPQRGLDPRRGRGSGARRGLGDRRPHGRGGASRRGVPDHHRPLPGRHIYTRRPAGASGGPSRAMNNTLVISKRELGAYFATPVAYVFIVIFLLLMGVFAFYLGGFYERNQADLDAFFQWHPWLYLFLIPALSMRLWAEERKTGTIELLMTLPVSLTEAVLGKFLAAWCFTAVALLLTFPIWITVNYLGDPDNGVIVAAYLGSLIMAGAFLAIGSCISALTKNQVIAFVVSVVVCFGFILSGFPMVLDFFSGWVPPVVLDAISDFSFLTQFAAIRKGVIDVRSLVYFLSLIALWLYATTVAVDARKAS